MRRSIAHFIATRRSPRFAAHRILALVGCLSAVAGALPSSEATAADAVPGGELCDGLVTRIVFSGNRVTRDEVMLRELPSRAGEPCVLDDVIDGIPALGDLGLFRSVRAELEAYGPAGERGLELRYVVVEKFFFLGVPRLSRTSDGELRAGIALEWDNFLGRLHELKLRSEVRREDEGRGRGGSVHSLSYEVPRFFGSRYGAALKLAADDRSIDIERDGVDYGEGRREGYSIGVGVGRWLDGSDGVQGTRVFFGTRVEHRAYRVESGSLGPFEDGLDLGFSVGFEQRRVHRDRWRRRGSSHGASFAFASKYLGSDFAWHRADVWFAGYRPLGDAGRRGMRNLNVHARLGLSDGAPFGERFYSVGGGNLLRGLEKGAHEGDVRFVVNVEYLHGWYARPWIRWVLFGDVGNAWEKDAIDPLDLELRAGVGLRWKIELISNTDLRVDLAWDPERGRIEPYLASRLTF